MPNLPKHICKHMGCTVLTSEAYCPVHKKLYNAKFNYIEKDRPNANVRGYTYRWQKVSRLYLKEHPICECEECQRISALKTASVVHHIIPHHGNYELFWDEDNWRAMNKICHDRHTLMEMREKNKGAAMTDGV